MSEYRGAFFAFPNPNFFCGFVNMKPEFMRKMRFSFFQKRKSNFPSTEETNKTQFCIIHIFAFPTKMEQKSEKKKKYWAMILGFLILSYLKWETVKKRKDRKLFENHDTT